MTEKSDAEQMANSQWELLRYRNFGPFFWTQFAGALNDNLFKNGLILFLTFSGIVANEHLALVNNVGALLFILPFFVCSAFAGQLADKMEKSALIRRIKLLEILLMALGAWAFLAQNLYFLMAILCLMGLQSTLFGPVKYSLLPQALHQEELIGGNALVEMGTFLAILLGTILAGLWFETASPLSGISTSILFVAIVGWICSRRIPQLQPNDPELKIDWHLLRQTKLCLSFARVETAVFLSILGISWFWFLGAAYLTQFAQFAKVTLQGTPAIATLFMAFLAIGIAMGSAACERLSRHRVEAGLVPIGAFGLTICGLDLGLQHYLPANVALGPVDLGTFITSGLGLRISLDILLLGIFGGLYIVPLYAIVQQRSPQKLRSRIIAANNIINAFAMVCSALFGLLILVGLEVTLPHFFIVLACMNMVVALYIFKIVPEFTMRFLVWVLTHSLYRIRHIDLSHIPRQGPALLVANHVTFMDALIIAAASPRPVRFVMFKPIFQIPILRFIFKTCKAIPIDSRSRDPQAYEQAFVTISHMLKSGELVCIFPEGKLTLDGRIDDFRPGVEKILKSDPVPVIPMAIKGLWGSYFCRQQKGILLKLPKKLFAKVELVASTPVPAEEATAKRLQCIVEDLFAENP
jgi:1-acyl-sn-glycerol-3-phosphate acyltransferase